MSNDAPFSGSKARVVESEGNGPRFVSCLLSRVLLKSVFCLFSALLSYFGFWFVFSPVRYVRVLHSSPIPNPNPIPNRSLNLPKLLFQDPWGVPHPPDPVWNPPPRRRNSPLEGTPPKNRAIYGHFPKKSHRNPIQHKTGSGQGGGGSGVG